MNFQDYRAATDYVSISELKSFDQSPFSYFKRYIEKLPDPNSKASGLAFGSLCHTLILEPHKFDEEYVVSDIRKDERTAAYKDLLATVGNRKVISSAELARAEQVANAATPYLDKFLPLTVEESYFYEGKAFKTKVKARFDGWADNGNCIVDIKTTSDVPTHEAMSRTILNFKYFWQCAFYMDVRKAITGEMPKAFYFVFCQTNFPYSVSLFKASKEMIEIGRQEYKASLAKLYAALRDKRIENFPKLPRQPAEIGLPDYYMRQISGPELKFEDVKL